jgi:hypothetical protein
MYWGGEAEFFGAAFVAAPLRRVFRRPESGKVGVGRCMPIQVVHRVTPAAA